jgi:hypothetical protein
MGDPSLGSGNLDELFSSRGRRRSVGLELRLDYAPLEAFGLHCAYALSSDRVRHPDTKAWRRSLSDRRHTLYLESRGTFTSGISWGLGLLVGSGTPYTPVTGIIDDEGSNYIEPIYGAERTKDQKPYVDLSGRIAYRHAIGRMLLGGYVEAGHILDGNQVESQEDPFYTDGGKGRASIDTRTFTAGLTLEF